MATVQKWSLAKQGTTAILMTGGFAVLWMLLHYWVIVHLPWDRGLPAPIGMVTIVVLTAIFFYAVKPDNREDIPMHFWIVLILGLIAMALITAPGPFRILGAFLISLENLFAIDQMDNPRWDEPKPWKGATILSYAMFAPLAGLSLYGVYELGGFVFGLGSWIASINP